MSYNRFEDKCYFLVRFTPLVTTQLDWADRWWEQTLSVKTTEEQLQAAVNIWSQVWLASDRTPLVLTDHLTHTHKCNYEMIQPAVNPFLLSLTCLIYLFSPQWWEGILCFLDDPIAHPSDRSPYTFRGSCRSIVPFTSEPGRVWNNAD